jgi:hypothetical protein
LTRSQSDAEKALLIPGSRHFGRLLKQQHCGKNRPMLSRSLFVFGLLLRIWIPAQADSVAVMDVGGLEPAQCTNGITPVGTSFDFFVAAPTDDSSMQCFATTTTAFQTLDFFFAAPPTPHDITSCTSTFFSICSITETEGITDVHFDPGTDSGIPTDTVFDVELLDLQKFTVGQQINAVANVPEPAPAWTIGLSLVAAAVVKVWRRARLQQMRDRTE